MSQNFEELLREDYVWKVVLSENYLCFDCLLATKEDYRAFTSVDRQESTKLSEQSFKEINGIHQVKEQQQSALHWFVSDENNHNAEIALFFFLFLSGLISYLVGYNRVLKAKDFAR